MSTSAQRIRDVKARSNLLKSVHALFSRSLPPVENALSDPHAGMSEASLCDNADDITILRSDFKCLPIVLEQIDFDHESDAEIERLKDAFDSLLSLLEECISGLDEIGTVEANVYQARDCFLPFPKLTTLNQLKIQQDHESDAPINLDTDSFDLSIKAQSQTPKFGSNRLHHYINLPPPHKSLSTCRYVFESFGRVVADISPHGVGRWDVDTLLQNVSNAEIASMKEASGFRKHTSCLYEHLVAGVTCEAQHLAHLHLSGFHTGQLDMCLGTNSDDRISARFERSAKGDSLERRFEYNVCAHTKAVQYQKRTVRVHFDEAMVWEDCVLDHLLYDQPTKNMSASTLDQFLADYTRTPLGVRKLDWVGRKTVGLLIAYSLFQLCESPWIQHVLEKENVVLIPGDTSFGQLNTWRPHISCEISAYTRPSSLLENIAALGVLLLELEANRSADWTEDDEDYDTETKSNRERLCRILKEWKGDIPDFYHRLGYACFRFENLVESFDHPMVDKDLANVAVLYKCIVNPLYQKLVSEYGAAERWFHNASGLRVPTRPKKVTVERLVLYDDLESAEHSKKSHYSEALIQTLENGFLSTIRALRQQSMPIGLAERRRGVQTPERIRIAVLDTGIDTNDRLIRSAKSRIVDERNLVYPGQKCVDRNGHGTHVTRILLQMAPAADIYVLKITDDNTVDLTHLSRIAEAINYAVKEWAVDIVSMSFGYEDYNNDIDDAVKSAYKKDKLMFAAASNEGGNKGRSRPGRDPKVICIHACDGKGNKGDMSPSPMKKKDNFATLGVDVKSQWMKQVVYKSGTSFATPMAAAIAADVLEFANFKCNLSEQHKRLLYRHEGMSGIFQAMSRERDSYDYVNPGHLWHGKEDEEVARAIEDILKEI